MAERAHAAAHPEAVADRGRHVGLGLADRGLRRQPDATALDAEPYDIVDVTFSHRGPRCSFDAFLEQFELDDRVLDEVAAIVRAADTAQLEQSLEAPGLLAISLGLSVNVTDEILLLEQAMPLYDALYAWRKRAAHETHGWPQPPAPS